MRRFAPFAAVVVALGVAGAAILPGAAAAESPTLNRIKAAGTISFGYRDNAVPFSYTDRDGRIRGYSVELCMRVAGAIQKELGMTELKIEWLPTEASMITEAPSHRRASRPCS